MARLRSFLARDFIRGVRGIPLGELAEGILPGYRGTKLAVLTFLSRSLASNSRQVTGFPRSLTP